MSRAGGVTALLHRAWDDGGGWEFQRGDARGVGEGEEGDEIACEDFCEDFTEICSHNAYEVSCEVYCEVSCEGSADGAACGRGGGEAYDADEANELLPRAAGSEDAKEGHGRRVPLPEGIHVRCETGGDGR